MTLLLDSETIELLKKIGYDKLGQTNVSKAVMFIAKDYESRNKEKE